MPIYQGGAEYSLIRQSKETLAQQRLALEQVRDQTRSDTVSAWGQLQSSKAQVASAQAQVTASEIALNGVREEAKAGQRTTLDVLNAQQALVNARINLVNAQHDRVVNSYRVLSTVGRLSPHRAQPAHQHLRPERALSSGARQLDRRALAGRSLIPLQLVRSRKPARPEGPLLAIGKLPDIAFQSGNGAIRAPHPMAFAWNFGGAGRGAPLRIES